VQQVFRLLLVARDFHTARFDIHAPAIGEAKFILTPGFIPSPA
jgi:hypothetical protein